MQNIEVVFLKCLCMSGQAFFMFSQVMLSTKYATLGGRLFAYLMQNLDED